MTPKRQFRFQLSQQAAPADLLRHPFFQKWFGGRPQVEIGVEFAAEAFNIEQCFLQQHELRLHLDIETSGGLEQSQQHAAERNILQRARKNRLANRTDCRFEGVDTGVGRRPARFDM